MTANEHDPVDRREFVKTSTAAIAGSALAMTARSYARVLGANDTIRLGQLGCGGRSHGHVHMVKLASKNVRVETVAVCDIWSLAREKRAAQVKQLFNNDPQMYKYSEQMLARNDIDGVMIATGDFQHAKLCVEVVRAGKDCYVEKPFANVLEEAKAARDAVKNSRQIVQMGTQHRTQPYQLAIKDAVQSGRLGKIVKIEQQWNVNMERWAGRPEVKEIREQDTDWRRWLLGKPEVPFNPRVYFEFRLFKNYSAGLFDQWLSHGSDLVHLWMDETHPVSGQSVGGIYVWNDGRENPDTCTFTATYPKGFLYTYTSTFGNSYRSFTRILGTEGTIDNLGGEGASLFMVTKEGGRQEPDMPCYNEFQTMGPPRDGAEIVKLSDAPPPDAHGPTDDDANHLENWLHAMQTRTQPAATVDHGFSHAIVCIMAAQSLWSGKRLYWNAATEQIVDQPVHA